MDRILSVLSLVLVTIATGATMWTIVLGNRGLKIQERTTQLTKESLEIARQTLIDASTSRREAEETRRQYKIDRTQVRLIQLSKLVEQIFWAQGASESDDSQPSSDLDWRAHRNLLRIALVGHTSEIPSVRAIVGAASWEQACQHAQMARIEVEQAMQSLAVD